MDWISDWISFSDFSGAGAGVASLWGNGLVNWAGDAFKGFWREGNWAGAGTLVLRFPYLWVCCLMMILWWISWRVWY